jgi:O-antigen ligase
MRALLDPDMLLLLLGGLLLVVELAALTVRSPFVGLYLFAVAAIFTSFAGPTHISLGSLQVNAMDVASAVLLAAGAVHALRSRSVSRPMLLFLGLLSAAFLRGCVQFGLQTAGNAGRELFYLFVAVAFTQTFFRHGVREHLATLWRRISWALILSALLFIARNGLGTYALESTRALNSAQALLVAQAGIMSAPFATRSRRIHAVLALLVVIASQQRTVWAASLVSIVVLWFSSNRQWSGGGRSRFRLVLLASGVAAGVYLLARPSELRDSLSLAGDVSVESGTFGWRVESWRVLLREFAARNGIDQAIGQPSGRGFGRDLSGQIVERSPHNMYIMALVSLGVVGFVLICWLLVAAVRRTQGRDLALNAIAWGLIVYSIGYQLPAEQGILVAAALAVPATRAASHRSKVPT